MAGSSVENLGQWIVWSNKAVKDIESGVLNYITDTAHDIETEAKLRVPVDTGRLKGSLGTEIDKSEIQAEVGTDVEYAEVVELGNSKQRPQPYLFPAFDRLIKSFESDLKKIVKKELN